MIKIEIESKTDDYCCFINTITASGHANYSKKGQDIICASVSTLIYGFINHLRFHFKENIIDIIENKEKIEIKFNCNVNVSEGLELIGAWHLLFTNLKMLEENFKEYIELNVE